MSYKNMILLSSFKVRFLCNSLCEDTGGCWPTQTFFDTGCAPANSEPFFSFFQDRCKKACEMAKKRAIYTDFYSDNYTRRKGLNGG